MALIKCPECNKDVSDKSQQCVHCGYPLRTTSYIHEVINGVDVDLSFINDKTISYTQKIIKVKDVGNCNLKEAKNIVDKYCPPTSTNQTQHEAEKLPKCSYCGSTNIQVVRKNWSFMRGFATNATERVCANCGRKM